MAADLTTNLRATEGVMSVLFRAARIGTIRSVRTFVILLCAAAAAGCLRVDVPNGALKCSSNPDRRCPEGYFCAGDNTCWKTGSNAPAAKGRGDVCVLASECSTGYCVDGRCCDSACTGQCQACDVFGGGCTTITGAPHRFRPSCPSMGFDTCMAVCDGQDAYACHYPDASKMCGAQTCEGSPSSLTSASVCDGAGRCVPVSPMYVTPCPVPPHGASTCLGNQCDFTCYPPYERVGSMCVMPGSGDMG